MKKLNRTLTLPAIIAISIAGMLGSIFVLPGIAAAKTGSSIWLAYLISAVLIIPAVLSKSELATAMPKAGGAYVFIERAFGPLFGTISGLGLWLSLIFKSAFALVGLGAYFIIASGITSISVEYFSIIFLILIVVLNLLGVKKVGNMQIFIVGLCMFSLLSLFFIKLPSINGNLNMFLSDGEYGLISTIAFVYMSYAGVSKIAAIAGEVKNPSRDLPRAMLFSLLFITIIYTSVSYLLVQNISIVELSSDYKPLYTLANIIGGEYFAYIISIIAVLTLVSMANSGVLVASRFPFAMSIDKLLPDNLSKLDTRFLTPIYSIILTGIVMGVIIMTLDVIKIVKLASAFKVAMFISVNLCVIILRETSVQWYNPTYKSPFYPYVQIFGVLSGIFLLFILGLMSFLSLIAIAIIGTIIYYRFGISASRTGVLKRYGQVPALYLFNKKNKNSNLNVINDDSINDLIEASINKDSGVIIPLFGSEVSPSLLIKLGSSLNENRVIQVLNLIEVPDQTSLDVFDKSTSKSKALQRIVKRTAVDLNEVVDFESVVTHRLNETIQALSEKSNIEWLILGWNGRAYNGIFFNNPLGWIVSHINSNFGLFKCSGLQSFENILLAIRPNSPDILKLIKATDKISRSFNTNFNMLHVVNSNITEDEINILKSTADQNLTGTCGKLSVIKSDDPIYTVSELTSEYDLLVLGTPRKDSLKSIFFGTGKDKFAVNATCSVLRLTVKNSLTNQ
jgi:amino acid transporter